MQKYNSRKEVPEKYKWDLTEFFKDKDDYNKNLENVKTMIEELNSYRGCTKDANKLYEYLGKYYRTYNLLENLYCYAILIDDQELGKSESIERKNKIININSKFGINTNFFSSELLKLNKEEYETLFTKNKKLEEYRKALDEIYREKEHILSENEENLITELVDSMNHFSSISSTLLNSEHKYGKVLVDGNEETLSTTNYSLFLQNPNEEVRKQAYTLFGHKLNEYKTTSASLLNGYVGANQTLAKIHHHKNAWEQKLFSLNVTDQVYKSLVEATENHLDTLHKYFKMRKKILNFDTMHSYDLRVNMSHSDKEYTIEEAQDLIIEALKPLGENYLEKFNKIITNRHIDYCQYPGKCSDGYNVSSHDKNSRILMSYNGDLMSVSTIAHEAGHNVHHQFIMEHNKPQYSGIHILVAEVASLTNECLLSSYIASNAKTKEEKLAGLENMIDTIVSNLFGAVREGKMEEDMYEQIDKTNSLTAEYLDHLCETSLKKYYGNSVTLDEYSKLSWITRSHYYMDFYLYSYAICISVAINVADKILKGDKEFIDRYFKFLSCGEDLWPMEIFEVLGINLEDKSIYENAIQYFDSLLDQYQQIYNEVEM